MALKQRINDDLKAALLGGDRFGTETLRGLKAAILNEEVAQNKREEGLEDPVIEQVIAREVKKRNESARLYEENGRAESGADERREAEILISYLPVQMSEADITQIIATTITELGATSIADMGKVIGAVKSKVGTSADGATVARLVKLALS